MEGFAIDARREGVCWYVAPLLCQLSLCYNPCLRLGASIFSLSGVGALSPSRYITTGEKICCCNVLQRPSNIDISGSTLVAFVTQAAPPLAEFHLAAVQLAAALQRTSCTVVLMPILMHLGDNLMTL